MTTLSTHDAPEPGFRSWLRSIGCALLGHRPCACSDHADADRRQFCTRCREWFRVFP